MTSRRNASATAVEVRVDVGVVELDVVDDGDVGQVLQELRGLVEERAVVLVAFDDELASAAEAIARSVLAEVPRDAADEDAGVDAAVRQHPAGERGGGGLAVRARDDDRARAPQEMIANRFGQRAVPDLAVEDFLELRVAARDGVADDDEIDVARDVLGAIAAQHGDAFAREKSLIGG